MDDDLFIGKNEPILSRILFWIQVSRPGLWFQTVWLYLLPTANSDLWRKPQFWLGLFFVTFPLNLLIYGWNDRVDVELDRINPRKGNFWFGAKASAEELAGFPGIVTRVQAPFWLVLAIWQPRLVLWLILVVLVNGVYNHPDRGWRSRPPLELVNVMGYLVLLPFSIGLNGAASLPSATYIYLALFCSQAHLMGEVMDIEVDAKAGRRTTATSLGQPVTKLLIMVIVGFEGLFLIWRFNEWVLGCFMFGGVAWLIFDFIQFRHYRISQFRLFAVGMNLTGYASIAWVWWQGTLLT